MKKLLALLALAPLLPAAIDGVVVNQSTGKPQSGVIVSLVQPGQNGMQSLASARSGADGAFKLDRDVPPPPALLQAIYQGVTYTQILAPGAPASGVRVMISDTTTNPAAAKLTQHILLLQPGTNSIQVNENFAIENETNQTFQDSKNGSVQFYVPDGVENAPELNVSGTAGMAIKRTAIKTDKPNIYKFDYAIKPGRTTFEAVYNVPGSEKFKGRVVGDTTLRLATPPSVTLNGDSIKDLGQEPQTKAHVYEVTSKDFEVTVEGTGTLGGGGEDNGEPSMHQENARLYTQLPLVLGFSITILLLGGVLIFRRGAA